MDKPQPKSDDTDSKSSNPLRRLWDAMSLLGAIVGFSSLAQTWLEDILMWKGWIGELIESYQALVYPAFDVLFGWLPWAPPNWLIDYLVIGIMFVTSAAKGMRMPKGRTDERIFEGASVKDVIIFILWHMSELLLWPIFLYMVTRNFIRERAEDFRNTLLWFGAIALGFVMLLSINAALLK